MCDWSYSCKLEDGTEFSEARVTSSFILPDVSAGIQISVLWYISKHPSNEASPQTRNQSI